jgi:phosphoribosylformylglycinamidine synthase
VLEIIRQGWVRSAHDCSEGGLAVALAECCMSNGEAPVGASIDLPAIGPRLDAALFGETQSRVIVSCRPENMPRIAEGGLPVTVLGATGGSELIITRRSGDLSWNVSDLRDVWWNAIGRLMSG